MIHILLSILIVFAVGFSFPYSKANADEKLNVNIEPVYEAVASDFECFSDTADTRSVRIAQFPTPKPLDVKRLYLKHYFNGLTENFGENAKGSCTYVALGMLLSYYDSYLCDDIVPEQYDVVSNGSGKDMIGRNNSPGTVNDKILNNVNDQYYNDYIKGLTKIEYYNILKEKFGSNSLQVYLMDLADIYNIQKIDNGTESFGSSFNVSWNLLSYYLWSIDYMYNTDYIFTSCREDLGGDVKQYIKDNIDLGNPVFVCGENVWGKGHAFICYDYDSNDTIYAHMGWRGDVEYTHYTPFPMYGFNLRAMAVDFKFEHTHSNNYMVGSNAYCYCDEKIETYHNHSYTCTSVSKTQHRAFCECGKSFLDQHWVKGPVSGRILKCESCGATINPDDGPIRVVLTTSSKTANGSYMLPNGIPVIMEEDVEAYLNGTLKFGIGISNYDFI